MRFKNLLGLLAIGGAVAYAQKRRGGDLSLNGIKNSLRGLADNVKTKLDSAMGQSSSTAVDQSASVGTSSVGSEYSSGHSSSYASNGSNGIDRKY